MLAVCNGEMSRAAMQRKLRLNDKVHFIRNYIKPALAQGQIEMTVPDKPNSRLQKYRLTPAGKDMRIALRGSRD